MSVLPGQRRRGLGLGLATALVIGNMIGSGVFLLPSSLAKYGGISLVAWVFTAAGAMLLALVFARLGRSYPQTGGPYAYSRRAFGDFVGPDRLGLLDRDLGGQRCDRGRVRQLPVHLLGRAGHQLAARRVGRGGRGPWPAVPGAVRAYHARRGAGVRPGGVECAGDRADRHELHQEPGRPVHLSSCWPP
jgi:hypothetical protein